jgi:hypothetical protein
MPEETEVVSDEVETAGEENGKIDQPDDDEMDDEQLESEFITASRNIHEKRRLNSIVGSWLNKKSKRVQHDCRVSLTDEDKLIRSQQLSDAMTRKALEIERHKAEKVVHKENITNIEAEIREYHAAIAVGYETRPLECYEIPVYKHGIVEIIRCDTHEKVSHRTMKQSEMQEALFNE